jgi:hypothetical protein
MKPSGISVAKVNISLPMLDNFIVSTIFVASWMVLLLDC